MHVSSRSRRQGQEGAAALEFALIAPILIVLFFGIVQVGITVWRSQVIEAAAREGARAASVGATAGEIETVVDVAATGFEFDEVNATAVTLCTGATGNASVTAQASGGRLDFEIPFVGSFTPTFTSTATFQCERGD